MLTPIIEIEELDRLYIDTTMMIKKGSFTRNYSFNFTGLGQFSPIYFILGIVKN
jgi:hypothetical protein